MLSYEGNPLSFLSVPGAMDVGVEVHSLSKGWDMKPGEKPEMRMVRFRTLGCYPLSGAVDSTATTLPEIIQEMLLTKFSERQGRLIDHDESGSMEKKKKEGYF